MKEHKLSDERISTLCTGLALMLHAGVGTGDGLALMAGEEPEGPYRALLSGLAERADEGSPLFLAFRETGRFPDYVCGLLEAGERSGRTEEALSALARHYEESSRLNRRIRSALLYPAVLLAVMLAVVGILLVRVLPVFDEVYAYLGGGLTGVSGWLLSFGRALDKALPVLCVLLGIVVVFAAVFAASPSFREKAVGIWRRHMGDKGVLRAVNTARIAQLLSLGLSSGLAAEESLAVAAGMLEDIPSAKARCLSCRERLEAGEPMAAAMKETGVLPPTECRLLELGIRGGTGDAAMEQIARRLTEDSGQALEETVGRVEPAMVTAASLLVGLILLSVMLPLMNIMTAIG